LAKFLHLLIGPSIGVVTQLPGFSRPCSQFMRSGSAPAVVIFGSLRRMVFTVEGDTCPQGGGALLTEAPIATALDFSPCDISSLFLRLPSSAAIRACVKLRASMRAKIESPRSRQRETPPPSPGTNPCHKRSETSRSFKAALTVHGSYLCPRVSARHLSATGPGVPTAAYHDCEGSR
jgi:hypothetical protein